LVEGRLAFLSICGILALSQLASAWTETLPSRSRRCGSWITEPGGDDDVHAAAEGQEDRSWAKEAEEIGLLPQ
jgi:hypothetical protein